MSVASEVKYRRPLNSQQLDVLSWIYRYRFSTSKQIALCLGRDIDSYKGIQKKLQILEEQALIGKRYDKSYKLAGRPAEYYLTPKGAKALEQARPNRTNPNAVKVLYKNKTVSQDFITHCLSVADVALKLQAVHGNEPKLKLFTKSQLPPDSYFPTWPPDVFISLQRGNNQNDRKRYFLDVWDGTKPFFISVRKTRNYMTYKDEGDWPDNLAFPVVLAICQDERTQKKLNRQMRRILNDAWDDELIFATTTKPQLDTQEKPTQKIWSKLGWDGETEPHTLSSLIGNP